MTLSVTLFSCKPHVSIEQRVNIEHYCTNTRYVDAYVWVRDWTGLSISLEYYEQFVVPESKADSTLSSQLSIANILKYKIESCIK